MVSGDPRAAPSARHHPPGPAPTVPLSHLAEQRVQEAPVCPCARHGRARLCLAPRCPHGIKRIVGSARPAICLLLPPGSHCWALRAEPGQRPL